MDMDQFHGCAPLLPLIGINDDGHRTIVDKADLHIGPKLAMLNVFQSLGVHQLLQKAS